MLFEKKNRKLSLIVNVLHIYKYAFFGFGNCLGLSGFYPVSLHLFFYLMRQQYMFYVFFKAENSNGDLLRLLNHRKYTARKPSWFDIVCILNKTFFDKYRTRLRCLFSYKYLIITLTIYKRSLFQSTNLCANINQRLSQLIFRQNRIV